MDKLKALGRGTQIMTVAAVLLLIDSFLKWETVDLGPLGDHGWSAWHGFLGVVMGILTIVLIARVAARLAAVDVPIPLSFATTSFVLGLLIAICGVLRFLTVDLDRTIWAWIGAALAIVVAVGAWLEVQEAGGIESLKADASNLTSSNQETTAAPAAAAAAAAPAAAAPAAAPPAAEPEAPVAEAVPEAAEPAPADVSDDEPSDEQPA
jgi:hypothetical protein